MLVPVISKIILGTVQFGLDYGINNISGKPSRAEIRDILLAAYEAGIRSLDSAEAYGNAHEVIGQFHRNNPTRIFDIITKLPHYIDGGIGEKIDRYIEELNVPSLQALLFHNYQTYKDNVGSIDVLKKYKDNGKIKYLGVSVYTNDQISDVIEDDNINILQLPFNLFDNCNLRGELLEKAKEKGKLIHTRSVFLQGLFFTSKRNSKVVKALMKELDYVRELSNTFNVTLNKMALNYCLQQSNIDQVLIGVDNLNQLKQNLRDADCQLSEILINRIDEIFIKDIDSLNPSLWSH